MYKQRRQQKKAQKTRHTHKVHIQRQATEMGTPEIQDTTNKLVYMVARGHTGRRTQSQTHKLHTVHRINNKPHEPERGVNKRNEDEQTTQDKTKHHGSNISPEAKDNIIS